MENWIQKKQIDCSSVVRANYCATQLFKANVYLLLKKKLALSLELYITNLKRSLHDALSSSHADLLINPLMYLNSCMYLQPWNLHLIEITIFPWALSQKLLVASRDFGMFERAKQGENARSHWELGDVSIPWEARAECRAGLTVWVAASSPSYPYGQELGLSNRDHLPDDTVPEKDHFDSPILIVTSATANRGRCTVRHLWWVETTTTHNSDKISPCFGFFDIPVCIWP